MFKWLFGATKIELDEQLYDLKVGANSLLRMQKKAQMASDISKRACHAAQEKGNLKDARLHADACFRERQWALRYHGSALKLKNVVARLDYAVQMNTVNETMAVITKNMMPALQSLDLNKIDKLMEQFTANCGAIDKALDVTDKAFEKSDANMTDVAGVDDLMNEVSDEVAHATGELLSTVPKRNLHPISGVDEPLANVALSLEARLKRLEVYGV